MRPLSILVITILALLAPAKAAPVTSHPRLWLTAEDLPRLRAWAVPANPAWAAFSTALNQAVVNYNTRFFPGGNPASPFPDNGYFDYVLYNVESYAQFFAFASLVDPNESARAVHAQRARRLLMHGIAEAKKGVLAGAPFRDPQFSTFNRANFWGEAWGLTVDWLQASGALTAQDLADIREVFLIWANIQLTAYNHPIPVGVVNSPALVTNGGAHRVALNNYYAGHMRLLTMMALSFDEANDPPLDAGKPAMQLGNSIRSYLGNATGAWLYQQYAIYEEAAKVRASLGIPTGGAAIGIGNGGLSCEGFLYGHSMGYLAQTLLALQTAGYGDPALIGPQAGMIRSPFWSQVVDGYIHTAAPVPRTYAGYAYLGPCYEMASYGDLIRSYISTDSTRRFLAIGALAAATGDTQRAERSRWIFRELTQGGAAQFSSRLSNIWSDTNPSRCILGFLAYDPALPAAPDPRPAMPRHHFAPTMGRVLARTDWSPQASWFTFKCSFNSINHQIGDGGQFEFYRKGEWLLKEQSGYTTDNVGSAPEFHNTLAIQNTSSAGPSATPTHLQWYETILWQRGAQWKEGQNAGDPVSTASFAADYVFAGGDMRNLYNRPSPTPDSNFMDVTLATRATLWLKPDHIIIYDRVRTNTAGRFKRFHLQMMNPATLAGKIATSTSASGQRCFIETLLPAAAVVTTAPSFLYPAQPELAAPMWQLNVEDPANPADERFLHVVQGADAGVFRDVPMLVQSSSSPVFEGAAIGTAIVLFPRLPLTAPLTPLGYPVPAGVAKHYITGLAPHNGYTFAATTTGITLTPGGHTFSDAAGVLAFDTTLSPFDNWRASHFGSNFAALPAASPLADFDHDGVSNVLEYIAGTNPTQHSPHLPFSATRAGENIICTFTRADSSESPDISLSLQTSSDLVTWPQTFHIGPTTAASSAGVTIAENGLGLDTVTVTIPAGGGRLFCRLHVEVNP